MTLQTHPPRAGTAGPRTPRPRTSPDATSQPTLPEPRDQGLDSVSRRLYASSAAGLCIAVAAAAALREMDIPMSTPAGQLLAATLTLGATMFSLGAATGSLRPSSHHGSQR